MIKPNLSNNQITTLLILAISISAVSTLTIYSLGFHKITGAAPTDTAITNVTVYAEVGCDFADDIINFGSVLQGVTNTSEQIGDWWLLSNTGTTNLSINLSIQAVPDWLWTSATGCSGTCVAETNYWGYKCNSTQSGACQFITYRPVRDSIGDEIALRGLEQDKSMNNATFGVNITVPIGESAGEKIGTVQAVCTAI